jgi:hypothetical protein
MTLPDNIADREHRKFVEDSEGNVGVRIGPNAIRDENGNKLGLDENDRAKTYDAGVRNELKSIYETLKNIEFYLKIIAEG